MALISDTSFNGEYNVSLLSDEGFYSDEIVVKDNSDCGFFDVGRVFTPYSFIGKKVRLNIIILEE